MFLVEHPFISPTVHFRTHRHQHSSRAAAPPRYTGQKQGSCVYVYTSIADSCVVSFHWNAISLAVWILYCRRYGRGIMDLGWHHFSIYDHKECMHMCLDLPKHFCKFVYKSMSFQPASQEDQYSLSLSVLNSTDPPYSCTIGDKSWACVGAVLC